VNEKGPAQGLPTRAGQGSRDQGRQERPGAADKDFGLPRKSDLKPFKLRTLAQEGQKNSGDFTSAGEDDETAGGK
jgi:hypothetical protein